MSSEPTRKAADSMETDANQSAVGAFAEASAIDVARPHWLHASSLLFDILSHFRQYLIPAAIAVGSAAQGSEIGLFIAVLIFVPSLAASVIRYFTLRYQVRGGDLIVSEGLFFRRVRTVPVRRIQNIDLVQNMLHRIFGVAEVRIETAGGTKPEATLRVLSMDNVDVLRQGVFEERSTTPADLPANHLDASTVNERPLAVAEPTKTLLEIPGPWLVRAGLASNRGMLIVGLVAGVFYQFDLEDRIDPRFLESIVPQNANSVVVALLATASVVALLVLLRLFGIVWFILRFHGYRLVRHGNDFQISCGLLTRVSATVPRKRIQFISVHRTLFMKWLGLAAIRIETAGGAGSENESATTTVSRRWFIPVLPEGQVSRIIGELRPGLIWNEHQLDWKPLAAKAARRLVRISIILSFLIAVLGFLLTWSQASGWGWLAGPVIMPAMIWWAIKKSRAMRYARTDYGVVYRSGVFNRKTSVTFYEKMQTLQVGQTPFDRRWNMATLSVDTAAAGPAEHRISVPYLDANFARGEYAEIVRRAARHRPVYG